MFLRSARRDQSPDLRLLFSPSLPHLLELQAPQAKKSQMANTLTTRSSLQLVCRQINTEWSPFFYSTTTIAANAALGENEYLRKQILGVNLRPEVFEADLFGDTSTHFLDNIRKISYNATSKDSRFNELNFQGCERFAEILRGYFNDLPSLEEVILHSTADYHYMQYLNRMNHVQTWDRASEMDRGWTSTPDVFKSMRENHKFSEWVAVRRMHGMNKIWFKARQTYNNAKTPVGMRIYELQIIFHKPGLPPTQDTERWITVAEK